MTLRQHFWSLPDVQRPSKLHSHVSSTTDDYLSTSGDLRRPPLNSLSYRSLCSLLKFRSPSYSFSEGVQRTIASATVDHLRCSQTKLGGFMVEARFLGLHSLLFTHDYVAASTL